MNTPLDKTTDTAAQEIAKIESLNKLGKQALAEGQIERALEKANEGLERLIQITDAAYYPLLIDNYILQTNIFLRKKDIEQAKNFAERALSICEEYDLASLRTQANLLLGKIHLTTRNNTAAISYLLAAKEDSQTQENEVDFVVILLYIGILYNQIYDYPKALEYLVLIEKEQATHLPSALQPLLFNSLGRAYFRSAQNEVAMDYFRKAETVAKQQNDQSALVLSLAYIGKIFARNHEFDRALRYAKRVNKLREEIGDVDGIQVNLINLGNIHYQLEKYSEGIKLTSRGIAAAKRMKDSLFEIRGYQIMTEIFRKQKDYKSAVMYQMIYTKFYEDFYQRNDRQKVAEIEHQFIVKKLEAKIQALSAKK